MRTKLVKFILLLLGLSAPEIVQSQQCQLTPYSPSQVPEAASGFRNPLTESNVGYQFTQETGNDYCPVWDPDKKVNVYTWVRHPGRDINAGTCCGNDPGNGDRDKGTPIYAIARGRVVNVHINGTKYSAIVIQHNYKGTTWYSQYGHIQNPKINCGDIVDKGAQIAEIGDNGTVDAHLHLEIRQSDHPAPTLGTYFCQKCGTDYCLQSLNNVNNWYEDPYPFISSHGAYTSTNGDFSLSVSPTSQGVNQGNTTSYRVTIQSSGGFSSPVSLSVQNLPNNQVMAGTGFNPAQVTPPANGSVSSTLTVTTNTCTPTGAFQISVRATSGSLVKTRSITLNVYTVTGISAIAWNFNTTGNREGWDLFNWAGWSVNSGKLFIDPVGSDPYIRRSNLSIDASRYGYVVFSMASNCPDSLGEVYFTTQASTGWNTNKKVPFTVKNCSLCGNAGFVTYFVRMCDNPYWNGRITGIRIDPAANGRSGTNRDSVAWDYIRVAP